ncbi:hypothetical protein VVMO6_04272 [Vibrio vulnificus MO6-24/O]|nr:hypothetical protein VVMO6_04272 [Vibrio vulnificus MO6-24/O]
MVVKRSVFFMMASLCVLQQGESYRAKLKIGLRNKMNE